MATLIIDKNKLLEYIGVELAQLLSQECPKISTRMARSFISSFRVEDGEIIYTLPHYAKYVIEGSPPHIITPKNKSTLAFKVDGKTIITKKVNHPGNAPNFFVKDTFNRNIKRLIEKHINKCISIQD